MDNEELKKIKKNYGEEMMHLCRELFPSLLEQPNLVYNILKENIAFTKNLASEIIENNLEEKFKNYIYSFVDVEKEIITTNKSPEELLKEKGYILYECKSEEDIQKFKRYYSKGEELCTFRNKRLKSCYVFFAVKENVEEIKREGFKNPKREDLYGTSVISIQFTRGDNNTLSIKNRYNHTVNNPDATYGNNLENIIPGLTTSFEIYYNLNINQNMNIYSSFLTDELCYVKGNDKKYYRYNCELSNIYYCENNIIIDNGIVIDRYNKEKERYILIDYFIIDRKDKIIETYDKRINDSLIDSIKEIGKIKDIEVTKDKKITIKYEDLKEINIELDKTNNIISYKNNYIQNIKDRFLLFNEYAKNIELPNAKIIGNYFLYYNKKITNIELPNAKTIGNNFLYYNKNIVSISISNVQNIGLNFLYYNEKLTNIELSKIENIRDNFLYNNRSIKRIELPKVKNIGDSFLCYNQNLASIEMPEVENIGNFFLYYNEKIVRLEMTKIKNIKDNFLYYNEKLKTIEILNVQTIGDNFLYSNEKLEIIKLPKVESIGNFFLYCNGELNNINLLDIKKIGIGFLNNNKNVKKYKVR